MLWNIFLNLLRSLLIPLNTTPDVKPEMGDCMCVKPEVHYNALDLPDSFLSFSNDSMCFKFHGGSGTQNDVVVNQMEDSRGQIAWINSEHLRVVDMGLCPSRGSDNEPIWPNNTNCSDISAIYYACKLLDLDQEGIITLWKRHPSGVNDDGFAYNNVRDACNGRAAARSHYNCTECPDPGAPGGHVCLNATLLEYIYNLHEHFGYIHVNEIAGACHSCRSVHYLGRAVDLDYSPGDAEFMVNLCTNMGGWGLDEKTHVHCQFT